METLKTFINDQRDYWFSELPAPKNNSQAGIVMNKLVNFLEKYDTFRNRNINNLMAHLRHLLASKQIIIVLRDVERMTYALDEKRQTHGIILPCNFAEMGCNNAINQLLELVSVAGVVQDFAIKPLLTRNDIIIAEKKGRAYKAEAALTLLDIINKEQIPYEFNRETQRALQEFPNGLSNMATDLRYLRVYEGN